MHRGAQAGAGAIGAPILGVLGDSRRWFALAPEFQRKTKEIKDSVQIFLSAPPSRGLSPESYTNPDGTAETSNTATSATGDPAIVPWTPQPTVPPRCSTSLTELNLKRSYKPEGLQIIQALAMSTGGGPIGPSLAEFQRQKTQLVAAELRAKDYQRKMQDETEHRRRAVAEKDSLRSELAAADGRMESHQKDYEQQAKECNELNETNMKLHAELSKFRVEHKKVRELKRDNHKLAQDNKKLKADLDEHRRKFADMEEHHTGESLKLLEHIEKLESTAKQTSPADELPKDDEASTAGHGPASARAQAAHDNEQKQMSIADKEKPSNQLLFPNVPDQSPSNVKKGPSIINDQQPHPRINTDQGLLSINDKGRHPAFVTNERAQGPFKNEQGQSSGDDETKMDNKREETSVNDEQAQSLNSGQPEQTFSRNRQDIDYRRDKITTGEEQPQASFDKGQAQVSNNDKVEQCQIDNDKRQDDTTNGQREPTQSDDTQEVPVSDEQGHAPRDDKREEAPIGDEQGLGLDVARGEITLDEDQALSEDQVLSRGDDAQQQVLVGSEQEHAPDVVAEEEVAISDDREHVPGDGGQEREEILLDAFGNDTLENVSVHDEQEQAPGGDLQEDISVKDGQEYIPGDGAQREVQIDASSNDTHEEVPVEDNCESPSGCGAQEDMSTDVEQEPPPGDDTALLNGKRHKDFIDNGQRQILIYKEQAQPPSNDENQATPINDDERQVLSTHRPQHSGANDEKQSSTIDEQVGAAGAAGAAMKDDRRQISPNQDQVQPQNNQQTLIEHQQQQQPPSSDQLQRTRTNGEKQEHSQVSANEQQQIPLNDTQALAFVEDEQAKAGSDKQGQHLVDVGQAPVQCNEQAQDHLNKRRGKQARSELEHKPVMALLTHEKQHAPSGKGKPQPTTDTGERSLRDVTREVLKCLAGIIYDLCMFSADRGLLVTCARDIIHDLPGLGSDLSWLREESISLDNNY
ncbi:MAG: hypothetical protein Q9184_007258, partial [Pyrenodesmia sp. 2 TL-2023]